jgi:hypothetical protein
MGGPPCQNSASVNVPTQHSGRCRGIEPVGTESLELSKNNIQAVSVKTGQSTKL